MILYIINSILCSMLLIAAYHLFLENETVHRFKRWYLLGTLILSLTIPLITIELEQPQLTAHVSKLEEYFTPETPLLADQPVVSPAEMSDTTFHFDWFIIILVAYGIVTAILLFRIFNNFLSILSDVNDKTVSDYREAILVLHNKHVIPYSFLSYIFISRQDFNNKQILLHELTHIRQRHTLDILLIEFIHCLMWFNPAMIFYKRAIRLNHEFLADEVVIKNYPTADYQNILFEKAKLNRALSLASSFNYSATKKRFIMMTTLKNETRASFRIVIAFLVTVSAVALFAGKSYGQNDSIPVVVPQPKINTDSLHIAKFESVVNKVIRYGKNKKGEKYIYSNFARTTREEVTEARAIFNSLTDEQKAKYPEEVIVAIKLAFTPPTPPQKKAPTEQELAALADPKIYGVWLDGKRVANSDLAKYKPSDIAIVWNSRLMKNAAHYGQYKFHSIVMTHAYFDTTYLKNLE